jgi:hypothetical protein
VVRQPATAVLDIASSDFLREQIGTVARIHRHFDLPFTPAHRDRMTTFLAEHGQDRRGTHDYSLEHFQLDADEIRRSLGTYIERFGDQL